MNVRDWPLGQIMQLPDCCFGRRFTVSCSPPVAGPAAVWDISEVALPEVFVIWELSIVPSMANLETCWFRLALGDQLPANAAQMLALPPLFMGMGLPGPEPRQISLGWSNYIHLSRLKVPVSAMGRRLVVEAFPTVGVVGTGEVSIVVSSIPREVPDCLLSR